MADQDTVRSFYEDYDEWGRFERHSVEFEINKRFIKRYIKSGDTVLDIGGGPGRYALELSLLGCDVTLLDLAPKHLDIAGEKATQLGLALKTVCGDACQADTLVFGQFDAVLLMGPLYHLSEERDRIKAVEAALGLLKPGGIFFAAFISAYGGVWDYLARYPEKILDPVEDEIFSCFLEDRSFSGHGFTANHFISPKAVLPFMAQFPLNKLHLVNSESFLLLKMRELSEKPKAVWDAWLALAEKVSEREEFLSMAGHYLYIGEKTESALAP